MFRAVFAILFLAAHVLKAPAAPDLRFDIVTFCCQCAPDDSFCQPQFDHLNLATTNGHFLAMGTDAHRLELATNGNAVFVSATERKNISTLRDRILEKVRILYRERYPYKTEYFY